MKNVAYLWGGLVLCMLLVITLILRVVRLDSRVHSLIASNGGTTQESLKRVQADLTTVKELAAGLGEYMTTIQLHAGKL